LRTPPTRPPSATAGLAFPGVIGSTRPQTGLPSAGKGEFYRTADLAATIAALVGTGGIDDDDAFAFRFAGTGDLTAWSFDGAGVAPRLVIEFGGGAPDVISPVEAHADVQGPPDVRDGPSADLEADTFHFLGTQLEGSNSYPSDYALA
jgi:hypothetical protein